MQWIKMAGPLAAVMATTIVPSGAMAASGATTRLVSCGNESCLRVSGRREDPAAPIYLNGREVSAKGARKWQADLPVNTVREWSEPFARTITISISGNTTTANLPIGLFSRVETLAFLTIRAK